MCGQTDAPKDNHGGRKALELLETRFGPEKAAKLMAAWQENWFTTADLDAIQKYGCNLLRVPFHYRNLQDANGKWKRDAKGNVDFTKMDWIVREADKRGMYVIFVLHIWPGDYNTISRDTPVGKAQRTQMAQLWSEVARHYRGVGTIAAFDVINEPEGSPGNVLQKAFYDAIRAQDAQRMCVFESVSYASIARERWTNIVWSAHYPENAEKSGSAAERIAAFDQKEKFAATPSVQVPIFIGEAKAPQDNADSAAELAKAFNDRGWHWAVWTYKGVDNGGWASMNYDRSLKYALLSDEYDALMEKWTKGLSQWRESDGSSNLKRNAWWIEGFSRGFKGG
jgi:aryl-phospho-beta-D-glucosidase BglC (GH1 family)